MTRRVLSLTLGLAVCVCLGASPALAQEEAPPVFYDVAYMKVAAEKAQEYVGVERDVWRAIHEERVKAGIIVGWDLYAVWFPGGTDAPYQYVTVNIYDDLAKMPSSFSEKIFEKAHPGKDMDAVMAKTLASRDLARNELWVQREMLNPEGGIKVGDYLTVGYMKVPPGGNGAYLRMERTVYKPIHAARVADGWIDNWGVNQLVFPGGTGGEYNWATVQVYSDFSKLLGGTPGTFQKAHPELTPQVFQSSDELREMVRVDLWELIDQVR